MTSYHQQILPNRLTFPRTTLIPYRINLYITDDGTISLKTLNASSSLNIYDIKTDFVLIQCIFSVWSMRILKLQLYLKLSLADRVYLWDYVNMAKWEQGSIYHCKYIASLELKWWNISHFIRIYLDNGFFYHHFGQVGATYASQSGAKMVNYRKVFNIRRTKSQNLSVSRLLL